MSREAVLQAARVLLGRDRAASVHDVASAAGVSRATVYRLFGSRHGLLEALDLPPDPDTRQRVLDAALELVDRDGLGRLSMEEVAAAAGVSRASLYRLFPGKAALFRELLVAFSPMETIVETLERLADQPPDVVVPAVARAAARTMAGRVGIVRTLVFEISGASDEAADAVRYLTQRGVGTVVRYIVGQMAAGRLRAMHPLLALQSLVGPILLHLITRRLAERELDLAIPVEETAVELAEQWVRAMRP
ncbi:MAG TPA: helix-turn-helix domain-containing protein [Candidatus Dormibacteraeota bacterium]|nr:helix-turn-helix domain-containing protein [Candidatus Dormibacteraeota bacterium]